MSPDLYTEIPIMPKPERIETIPHREQPARDGSIQERKDFGNQEREKTTVERKAPHEEAYATVTAPIPQSDEERGNIAAKGDADIVIIEQILAEHMEDLYSSLPENKKGEFKARGEDAAQKIQSMFARAKVRVKDIMYLIISWLSLIPGVNKFFIEQQAEIKTNKLLAHYEMSKK